MFRECFLSRYQQIKHESSIRLVNDDVISKISSRLHFLIVFIFQIVWKGSKQLGVGTAISKKNNRFIIVARYKTGGNVGGPEGFKKNIFPLGKGKQ